MDQPITNVRFTFDPELDNMFQPSRLGLNWPEPASTCGAGLHNPSQLTLCVASACCTVIKLAKLQYTQFINCQLRIGLRIEV